MSSHADPSSSSSSSSRRKGKGKAKAEGIHSSESLEKQASSIAKATRIPISLQQSDPSKGVRPPKSLNKIKDKKLRSELSKSHLSQVRAKQHKDLAQEFINVEDQGEESGLIETENDLERTYRLTQSDIKSQVGIEAATKSFDLKLDGLGPYRCDYTRNGRHLLLGGRKGHLASFDWKSGKLNCEIQVRETVRDVKFLHNQDFFAAAQKKYVYIYDSQGTEIHRLKQHLEVQRMEFLPYHFLLATVGNSGYLKYQDTSTGQLVSQHRSGLGVCQTMCQNPLTAIIHLGHSNGTVTLWTPNLSTPALSLLAHRGPVTSISVNTASSGREIATSGLDGSIKIWDSRNLGKGAVKEWISRKSCNDLSYSQRGFLGVSWGNHVSIYNNQTLTSNIGSKTSQPGPYLTNGFPRASPMNLSWCPFEDVLGVGNALGFSSLIVPGAGEPRFDSLELDPFENKKARREREVRSLLDKIQPDMISLDTSSLGQLNTSTSRESGPGAITTASSSTGIAKAADGRPYARLTRMERLRLDGKSDEDGYGIGLEPKYDQEQNDEHVPSDSDEELPQINDGPVKVGDGKKEKKKARGKNGAMKRYLKKQRKNVVDPNTIAIREKLERSRIEKERERKISRGEVEEESSSGALDIFNRSRKRARN